MNSSNLLVNVDNHKMEWIFSGSSVVRHSEILNKDFYSLVDSECMF